MAVHQRGDRLQVAALARVRRQAGGGGDAGARHREGRRLGAEQVQPGLQRMGHDEIGTQRECRIDARHRILDVAAELVQGAPVVGGAVGVGAGAGEAVVVVEAHLESPSRGGGW